MMIVISFDRRFNIKKELTGFDQNPLHGSSRTAVDASIPQGAN
jgi:hypothetical protein